jgi:alkanesulfonate monooxygenase SsuD/methylene tetrahydromethanopterin reductase-like flavin-dependent oxidoreductase (luciferase family)
MSDEFVDTERSAMLTPGQDCPACRNGVHADCAGRECECYLRGTEPHPMAFVTTEDIADAAAEAFGRDPALALTTKPQRLLAQYALVPGDIADGSHSYEGTLMETADAALERLQQVAAKEGKRLKRPVMCRVVVEAWVEDE